MKLRILVVDDDIGLQRFIRRVLESSGHEVFAASTGLEAIVAADHQSFDVAIVDYAIPAPNGVEVLAMLRSRQPTCAGVLISAELDLAVATTAVNRGHVIRILSKPIEPCDLTAAIEEAVRRQASTTVAIDPREKAELDRCFGEKLLALATQPIVDRAGRVVAYEALLRSRHPAFKGPLEVLSAVERHQQIGQLGDAVTEMALEQLSILPESSRLFINLHPQELRDPSRLDARVSRLAAHAHRITYEITERQRAPELSLESIALLRQRGFSLAVDDLGAGYSSLSVLANIQPDIVKVDMSIIRGIDRVPAKQRLLELLCQFAAATHARVVAEGVETDAEAAAVRSCGVDLLQGYLFGKPEIRARAVTRTEARC
jgi:EAL domain-containing protein (putative c-di-GMP-specific phosphodiesterase class I)